VTVFLFFFAQPLVNVDNLIGFVQFYKRISQPRDTSPSGTGPLTKPSPEGLGKLTEPSPEGPGKLTEPSPEGLGKLTEPSPEGLG
jgi:hypothetical protein